MSLKKLLIQEKWKFLLYGFGVLIASVTNIIFTFGMSYSFKVLDTKNLNEVLKILMVSILIMITPAVLQLMSRLLRVGFMADVLKQVRLFAYQKIMRMDVERFHSESKEAYQSAMVSDINLFESDFFLSVMNIGYTVFSFTFSFLILVSYSWVIGLIALGTSMIQVGVAKLFEKRVRKARADSQHSNKAFNTVMANMISGFNTIKSYGSERLFSYRFADELESLETVKARYFGLNKDQEHLSHAVSTISVVSIFFISALLMTQNRIRIGDFIVILNLSTAMVWGMVSAIAFLNRFKASVDIYNRIVDVETPTEKPSQDVSLDLSIKVENLSYAYGDLKVVDNLSFTLGKNEKLLIHGPSGTGKTTLLNCLSQNLLGYEGSITYGEQDLKTIHNDDFLNLSSYVRQSHFMFQDSIKNNIIMNRPFDERKFKQVIQDAALESWIEEVGWDHQLSFNGKNISGGQRQRLSMARELYADKDLIFIDEPSASLDDENAAIIYKTILNLDKTVICVSHRHLDLLKGQFDKVISFEEVHHEVGE